MPALLHRIMFRPRGLKGRWSAPRHDKRCTAFAPERIASHAENRQRVARMHREIERRAQIEHQLSAAGESIPVPGHCCVCHLNVVFHADLAYGFSNADGGISPNWRERVVCPVCRLNNRMRAAIHFLQHECAPAANSRIYVTEQTTPLFDWMQAHYPLAVGSEYLGTQLPLGATDARGIRNESLTRLTFPDASFNYILSFDVFEHIPDFRDDFRECLHCMKPDAPLVFAIPFNHVADSHNLHVRLNTEGEIEHLQPPECDGDPLRAAGCLCFYHFGWDLLGELHALSFADAAANFFSRTN